MKRFLLNCFRYETKVISAIAEERQGAAESTVSV